MVSVSEARAASFFRDEEKALQETSMKKAANGPEDHGSHGVTFQKPGPLHRHRYESPKLFQVVDKTRAVDVG
jgi:hypothetical protein